MNRTKYLWNTGRTIQIQIKLDQPSRKNGQHQTSETRPQLQTSRKKRSWTPQETMATRRCRNRSIDPNHERRWWCLNKFTCNSMYSDELCINSRYINVYSDTDKAIFEDIGLMVCELYSIHTDSTTSYITKITIFTTKLKIHYSSMFSFLCA